MEVSVIGSSQVRVSSLNDFSDSARKLMANMSCDVRKNISERSFLGESRRSSVGLRLRASASAQKQAAVSEKATSVWRTRPNEAIKLYVGLPLDTVSTSHTVNHARAISAGLKALKLLGVTGVDLPVWWGIAENEGPGKYEWSGYRAVVDMVHKLGLEVRVSLCFHASSKLNILLPKWVSKIGESDPSIYFADRMGRVYKHCLTWAVDDLPVLDGKAPVEVYNGFFESFKATFATYMGEPISNVTIGLGPDGLLSYPVKGSSLGEFQCYDKNMLADLKRHAELHGCPLWGLGGPHDAPGAFFAQHGGSWATRYGDFFLSWYSGRLIAHGARVLSSAASAFESLPVRISAKIPLTQYRCKASEMTTGFYSTDGRVGYGPVFEMLSRNSCGAVLTGMDLAGGPKPPLMEMLECCGAHGVEASGENSEVCEDFEWGRRILGGVGSFTYQRMGARFFSPEHFPGFTQFVRGLNGPGLGQGQEEESLGRKIEEMQAA